MARYFNPASFGAIMAAGGRPIEETEFSAMMAQLLPGECLAWHLDRGRFQMVADITDPGICLNFCRQADDGELDSLGHYAMPKSADGWDKEFDWDKRERPTDECE